MSAGCHAFRNLRGVPAARSYRKLCAGSRFPAKPAGTVRAMQSRCKTCLYCSLVQYMSLGDPPPVKGWKRPVLAVAGLALTISTVMALRFAWERTGALFFATVSVILMMIALLGVAISVRGCDHCVARYLGKTL
jgi:hypothetical protein